MFINGLLFQQRRKGKYAFVKIKRTPFVEIMEGFYEIEILNSTPKIVEEYSLNDEQRICSQIRYTRLIDILIKLTFFHFQSHIRTSISNRGGF